MIDQLLIYLQDQFLHNEFFSAAAVATLLGSLFYQIRSLPITIWNRISKYIKYEVNIYQNSELYEAMEVYLYTHHDEQKYRIVEAKLSNDTTDWGGDKSPGQEGNSSSSSEEKSKAKIIYQQYEDSFIVWHRGIPIVISKSREKLDNASSFDKAFLLKFNVTAFNKVRVNSFIEDCYSYYKSLNKSDDRIRVNIYQHNHWTLSKRVTKNMDNVILKNSIKEEITEDLKKFLDLSEYYNRINIPYKRGYLLYGSPGNGKTSLAMSLAGHFKRDIYYLNILSLSSDEDLQTSFNQIDDTAILVIEDIDASFEGRKKLGRVTFSALLNCLDGIFYKEGLITIITTNHRESLDPALIRPGRIDLEFELKNPTWDIVEEYLELFYSAPIQLQHYNDTRSMAEVVKCCMNNSSTDCRNQLSLDVMERANGNKH